MLKKTMIGCLILLAAFGIDTIKADVYRDQCTRAREYLDQKSEVYFTFFLNNRNQLNTLQYMLSIDHVVGNEVYAYANAEGFDKFIETGILFKVLPHPGDTPVGEVFGVDQVEQQMRQGGIDKFPSYDGYVAMLQKYAQEYPKLCKFVEFGSTQSHKLVAVVISKDVQTPAKKAKVLYNGTVHGDEYVGFGILLNLIDYLLKNYGTDPKVTQLVDNVEFWINPLANPDGCYRSGNSAPSGSTRGNAGGRDVNRSFPNPAGASGEPVQIETKAFMKLEQENRFTLALDIHAGTQEVVYPWGVWTGKRTADEAWWVYVAKNYAKTAAYFSLVEIGWQMYEAPGERMNYSLYYNHCRDMTLELSNTKPISSSQILNYWSKNKEAILQFTQEALYGFNGIVTDSCTGKPIAAKVFISGYDKDSTHVYSGLPVGDYFRPIAQGNYKVTFSAKDYVSKTLEVNVETGKTTVLDVKLRPTITAIALLPHNEKYALSAMPVHNGIKFACLSSTPFIVHIYSAKGALVKTIHGSTTALWDKTDRYGKTVSQGCYVLEIGFNDAMYTRSIIIKN